MVLRAGSRVLKVLDGWSDADRAAHAGKLHHLRRHAVTPALPRVLAVHDLPEALILETDHEPSRPYDGGHGALLVALLRSLHEAGWVHTNLHPKNLRVTARGITVIDLGRSLEAATPEGEAKMARRALLAFRWSFRSDLDALMRRSIESGDFPELVGWEHLHEAARGGSVKQRLDAEIARDIREADPRRLFDYGCGKPRDVAALAAGRAMTVFDPDASLRRRWGTAAPEVAFLGEQGVDEVVGRGQVFDLVLCSLVLCAVDNDAMREALQRIRRLVSETGRVLVAVCDPTSHQVRETTYQRRVGVEAIPYEACGTYSKHVEGAATPRVEHHRPLHAYRRDFARAGLAIRSDKTIDGIDVERFERVSEFVLFEPRPLPALDARTTLLIKACAMEAQTIGEQIEHLPCASSGSPRAFDEVLLFLDPHHGPFRRGHCPGDLDAAAPRGLTRFSPRESSTACSKGRAMARARAASRSDGSGCPPSRRIARTGSPCWGSWTPSTGRAATWSSTPTPT